jgi:hypothetical protein
MAQPWTGGPFKPEFGVRLVAYTSFCCLCRDTQRQIPYRIYDSRQAIELPHSTKSWLEWATALLEQDARSERTGAGEPSRVH